MVPKDCLYCVDRNLSRQSPGSKPNTVESVEVTSRRYEPEETVRGLRNRSHAGRRGAILYSPRRMDVLRETFIRIEGMQRVREQQYADKTTAERGRDRGARPVKGK